MFQGANGATAKKTNEKFGPVYFIVDALISIFSLLAYFDINKTSLNSSVIKTNECLSKCYIYANKD